MIVPRYSENLERDHLIVAVAPVLPNLGHLGDVLGAGPLFHDGLECIRCWDRVVATTQFSKFYGTPMRELLGRKYNQNRKGRDCGSYHLGDLIDALLSHFTVQLLGHCGNACGGGQVGRYRETVLR